MSFDITDKTVADIPYDLDFKELYSVMPAMAKKDKEEFKMAGHAGIVKLMTSYEEKSLESEDGYTYFLCTCVDVIENMNIQIFEHYKAMCNLYKSSLYHALASGASNWSVDNKHMIGASITKACKLGILNPEKYAQVGESFSNDLETDIGVLEGTHDIKFGPISKLDIVFKTSRSVSFVIDDGGIYNTNEEYSILVDGQEYAKTDKVVTSVYGLYPDREYLIEVVNREGNTVGMVDFHTDYEAVTLNVKDFGAVGDGVHDDTRMIQAAILSCPENSRVLIPAGTYKISSIFLKSDINVELAKGAELSASVNREDFPILPGLIETWDGNSDYNLGSWEGNPLNIYSAIITGISVKNVKFYGEGTVNGNASHDNWWSDEGKKHNPFRPRTIFINHCENIGFQGITVTNSPSWTIHPYFSNNLKFVGLTVLNPAVSPNTDGLDPESCRNLDICGVKFSLGDDCIAVKSGKIYMGSTLKTPCENIHIYQCLMENGHGAVTVGSEMAGGVINMTVEKCLFSHTDRGLRIKTRRGRGKDAILDGIVFKDIIMDNVMSPFTANAFYFCDPDGRTEFVQTREAKPVDDGTPAMKNFLFENITAKNCHVAASYFVGLTESPIECIEMRHVYVDFAEECKTDVPIMSWNVDACSKHGIYAQNIDRLILNDVEVKGAATDKLITVDVANLSGEVK